MTAYFGNFPSFCFSLFEEEILAYVPPEVSRSTEPRSLPSSSGRVSDAVSGRRPSHEAPGKGL